jgi:hypothetical protein
VGSNQKLIHVDGNNEDILESEEEEESEELEMKKRFCQDEKKRMQPHEHTNKARLCKDVHDKPVTKARGVTKEEENVLFTFLRNNQVCFPGARGISREFHMRCDRTRTVPRSKDPAEETKAQSHLTSKKNRQCKAK